MRNHSPPGVNSIQGILLRDAVQCGTQGRRLGVGSNWGDLLAVADLSTTLVSVRADV